MTYTNFAISHLLYLLNVGSRLATGYKIWQWEITLCVFPILVLTHTSAEIRWESKSNDQNELHMHSSMLRYCMDSVKTLICSMQ